MQRTVWKHFALVLLLLVLYDLVWQLNSYIHVPHPSPMPWFGVARALGFRLPWLLIGELPLAAGISLAVLDLHRGAMRTAVIIAVLTIGAMIVYDVWIGPQVNRAEYAHAGDSEWPNTQATISHDPRHHRHTRKGRGLRARPSHHP